ncbi:hypothetical protein ACFL0P_00400 [Candidatus Omnitrophota bacterium]
MIKSLVRARQINVITKNEIGALARMMSFLVNHGINVETIAGYSNYTGDQGNLAFITDKNTDAISELISNGYENISESDVIIMEIENRPGTLKNISEILARIRININYLYCTSCSGSCPTKIVFSTSDNDRAIKAFTS